jgi:hypothetical protein
MLTPWWHWRRWIGQNLRRESWHFRLDQSIGPFKYEYKRATRVAREALEDRYGRT